MGSKIVSTIQEHLFSWCSEQPWTALPCTTPSRWGAALAFTLRESWWLRLSSPLCLSPASSSSPVLLMPNRLRKLSKLSQQSSLQALPPTSQRCHSASKSCKLVSWTHGTAPTSLSWRTTQLWLDKSAKHRKSQPKLSHLRPALVGQLNHSHNRTSQALLRPTRLWPLGLPTETIWKYCWTLSPSYETYSHLSTFKFEILFPLYKARL